MPHRIVVIDDVEAIVDLYDELFTDAGYEVVGTFARPPATVRPIAELQPDLIIMDWLFGQEETGMALLELLKLSLSTAAIPVIVCTAAQGTIAADESVLMQRGVRIVHKPFGIDDLLAIVKQVLG
jgi:two-component system, OmpR family, response regulator VicR